MITSNLVIQGRSVAGGHAIEVDFELHNGAKETVQIPFSQTPRLLRAIWEAAATAETTQRRAAGDNLVAVVAPYRATDVRLGSSQDGTILVDFSTAQGPMQIAMAADLAHLTIERLAQALADRAGQHFPRPS